MTFSQSFGPSGEQSRAVANGQHADFVNFSLEPDVERLVKSGMVQPSWNQTPTKGMVTNSVDVIIVRKGNPKHITGWSDLVKPGVQVLTPNPFTSGAARWNILGAYGAQLKEGKTEAQAEEYLKQLFHNTVSQDSSARNALQTFLAGRGDALLDYETEAIADQKKGAPIEYIIPGDTIQIENPLAVVGSSEGAEEVRRIPPDTRRAADLGGTGLPARDQGGARGLAVQEPARPLHDRLPRRLEEGRRKVLRKGNRAGHEDRGIAWRLNQQIAGRPRSRHPRRRGPAIAGRATGLLGRGLLVLYLSILVLLPMAALVGEGLRRGHPRVLERGLESRRPGPRSS